MPAGFQYELRVRYADIDKMGIVYHSRYLEWFEAARTELLRTKGMTYLEMEKQGYSLPVIEAHCEYKLPVYYDDLIAIQTNLTDVSRIKIRLDYHVLCKKDQLVKVKGYTIHCFMDKEGRPVRAPKELFKIFCQIVNQKEQKNAE